MLISIRLKNSKTTSQGSIIGSNQSGVEIVDYRFGEEMMNNNEISQDSNVNESDSLAKIVQSLSRITPEEANQVLDSILVEQSSFAAEIKRRILTGR